MGKSKPTKSATLKHGRPPLANKNDAPQSRKILNARSKSSKATRKLINAHHQLHKARAVAIANQNEPLVGEIDEQIEKLGGLSAYQAASLTGQDKDRGGDSSEKLVLWLRKYGLIGTQQTAHNTDSIRVLEIGALSSRNAISSMIGKGVQYVKRIDLHSQEPDTIEEIDFMDLSIPKSSPDKFDIISLSLVLNYVPDAIQRGEMLRRTVLFLRSRNVIVQCISNNSGGVHEGRFKGPLPGLFVVLPLSCLSNSRYMTHNHFISMVRSLGYQLIERQDSQKLTYMLFRWQAVETHDQSKYMGFRKVEINPGTTRNNFAIVLEPA